VEEPSSSGHEIPATKLYGNEYLSWMDHLIHMPKFLSNNVNNMVEVVQQETCRKASVTKKEDSREEEDSVKKKTRSRRRRQLRRDDEGIDNI
jgi:hypothetical protein